MSEQQPTEPERLLGISPEPPAKRAKEHLLGSPAADMVAGIVASILWWVGVIAVATTSTRQPVPGLVVVGCLFAVQLLAVGLWARGSTLFIVTQLITAILLPILALGLFFGACLLMAR